MGGVHVSFDTLVASVPVADSRFESYYEGEVTLDALGISVASCGACVGDGCPVPEAGC